MKTTSKISVREINSAAVARIMELKEELAGLTNDTSIKESTKSTRRHALRRDLRIASLLAEMALAIPAEEVAVSDEALVGFNQLCFPSDGGSKVVVEEGDSILELMEKFAEVKDLLSKLNKAADKIGCKLDFTTGKVVKK